MLGSSYEISVPRNTTLSCTSYLEEQYICIHKTNIIDLKKKEPKYIGTCSIIFYNEV